MYKSDVGKNVDGTTINHVLHADVVNFMHCLILSSSAQEQLLNS